MIVFQDLLYDKKGTGRGPGANFRKGHDYENHEVAGGKVLGELNWWELTTWTASNSVTHRAVNGGDIWVISYDSSTVTKNLL